MKMLDLFCGRWGWSRAFTARGWECVGIDLVHPAELPGGCEFHQNGKISQELPDFYLLRLEQVPYTKHAIHLIIPGDTKTKTFSVGINGLLSQDFADNAKMFDRLRDGTLRKITLDKYSKKV